MCFWQICMFYPELHLQNMVYLRSKQKHFWTLHLGNLLPLRLPFIDSICLTINQNYLPIWGIWMDLCLLQRKKFIDEANSLSESISKLNELLSSKKLMFQVRHFKLFIYSACSIFIWHYILLSSELYELFSWYRKSINNILKNLQRISMLSVNMWEHENLVIKLVIFLSFHLTFCVPRFLISKGTSDS